MPAMPGAHLAVIEAQFLLGTLEAFLNGPAQASGPGQFGKFSPGRGKHQIIGVGLRILRLRRISTRRSKHASTIHGSEMRPQSYNLIPLEPSRHACSRLRPVLHRQAWLDRSAADLLRSESAGG